MPGNVLGTLSRGSVDSGEFTIDRRRVLDSFREHGFSLSVGIALVAILLLTNELEYPIIAFDVTIIATVALCVAVMPAIRKCLGILKRLDATLTLPMLTSRVTMGGGYIMMWIASAAPILVLMQSTLSPTPTDALSIIAVSLVSMIAGWLAVLASEGIGIREFVFVLMAPEFLTWQESLYWIASHRRLYTLFDLAYGILALGFLAARVRTVAIR